MGRFWLTVFTTFLRLERAIDFRLPADGDEGFSGGWFAVRGGVGEPLEGGGVFHMRRKGVMEPLFTGREKGEGDSVRLADGGVRVPAGREFELEDGVSEEDSFIHVGSLRLGLVGTRAIGRYAPN